MKRKYFKNKQGFTILETMVSVSLFLIIVMTGLGTLLNANLLHKKSEDQRSIMDNLSFIMEDMSKNLRTGYNYQCFERGTTISLGDPSSCSDGWAIAFEATPSGSSSDPNDQWVYKIESTDGGTTFNISKSTDSGSTWTQLNPNEVIIDSISGFTVLGAEPPTSDSQQPLVNIRLVGKIILKDNLVTPFSLQTSVSQRLLDI